MSAWDPWDILATLPAEVDQPGSIPGAPKVNPGKAKVTDARKIFQRRQNLRDYLRQLFSTMQLPPSLADWALNVMIEGSSGAELQQRLYLRPEFQHRFRAIFQLQKMGQPAPTPAEVIAYERNAAELMHSAGMPPGFYDKPDDFVDLIVNRVSANELASRINQGFIRVQSGPRAVREAFASFFGPSGDAALAAVFLDPKKALPALQQQVGAAEIAGAGFNFGFKLSRDRSLEAAGQGYDYAAANDRFANLVRIAPLFSETISEHDDIQAETEGVQTVFGLEGASQASRKIEQRSDERAAAFEGGGGAMGSARTGARGLGAAT